MKIIIRLSKIMIEKQLTKNLSSKAFVDNATGEIHYHYYWKRNKAPKVEITGLLPNKLSGLTLIQKDLGNALRWIKAAKELTPKNIDSSKGFYYLADNRSTFDLVKALFVASLTFYGKCFTEANGRSAQVSRDWLDAKHKKAHDYYMMYRHNFAAHSGDEKVELAKTFVLLHPKKNEILPLLPTMRMQPDLVFTHDDEDDLEELIEYVINLVSQKYNDLAFKITNDLVMVKNIDFWKEQFRIGETVELNLPRKQRNNPDEK